MPQYHFLPQFLASLVWTVVKDFCFLQYVFCDYSRIAQILKGPRWLLGDKWSEGKIDALRCPDRADRMLREKGKGRKMRIGLTGTHRARVFLYASCARFVRWCNSLFRALLLYGSTCSVPRLCFQLPCRPWLVMAIPIQDTAPSKRRKTVSNVLFVSHLR